MTKKQKMERLRYERLTELVRKATTPTTTPKRKAKSK